MRRKSDGAYVGDLGFADFHRPVEPALTLAPEAGWVLATWAHRQSFATEALQAAHAWIDAKHDIDRTTCIMSPDNTPSRRVA